MTISGARIGGTMKFEIRNGHMHAEHSGSYGKSSATMEKVSTLDDSVARLRAAQGADVPISVKPGLNVPPECAAFYGVWVGTWQTGQTGELKLHISGVDEKCVA